MPLKQCISCGRWVEIPKGRRSCQECKEKKVLKDRKRREERKAVGLCIACGKMPAVEGSERCYGCTKLWQDKYGVKTPRRRSRVNNGLTISDIVKIGLETGEHYGETVARLEGRKRS